MGEIEACYGRPVGTVVAVAGEVIAAPGSESAGSEATAGRGVAVPGEEAIGAKVSAEHAENVGVVSVDVASAGAAGAGDRYWILQGPSRAAFHTGQRTT